LKSRVKDEKGFIDIGIYTMLYSAVILFLVIFFIFIIRAVIAYFSVSQMVHQDLYNEIVANNGLTNETIDYYTDKLEDSDFVFSNIQISGTYPTVNYGDMMEATVSLDYSLVLLDWADSLFPSLANVTIPFEFHIEPKALGVER
jgi:CBS domain containing-hemolysin-like protein